MRVKFFTVTKCLKALRSVLQRDLAMQLLVKQYGARNSRGPPDFSPSQEWHLFLVVLFTLLGYDVDKLQIIQQNNNDHKTERPIVVSKKQKTNYSGRLALCAQFIRTQRHQQLHGERSTHKKTLQLRKYFSPKVVKFIKRWKNQ